MTETQEVLVKGRISDWTEKFVKDLFSRRLKNINKAYVSILTAVSNDNTPRLNEHEILIQVGVLPNRNVAHETFYDKKLSMNTEAEDIELPKIQTLGFDKYAIENSLSELRDEVFQLITDEKNGRILAIICLNKVWVTFDAFSVDKNNDTTYRKSVDETKKIATYVIDKINEYYVKNPLTREEIEDYKIKIFSKTFFTHIEDEITNLRSTINNLNNNINDYETRLSNTIRDIKTNQRKLNMLSKMDMKEEVVKLRKRLKDLEKHKHVEKIDLNKEGIVIYTDDIKCSNRKIGKYRVCLTRTNITIKHIPEMQDNQHPHVSREGTPCLGDFSSVIKYLNDMEYDAVVEIMIAFLQTYSADDSYIQITEFCDILKEMEQQRLN